MSTISDRTRVEEFVATADLDLGLTSGSASVLSTTRKRDEEFWFEDGTIILMVQDIEFRLYRRLLASRFPVFEDMFSLPQPTLPPSADKDGTSPCAEVYLSDSARDWRAVLRLMMPTQNANFFSQPPGQPSFETIVACVRLGHKYQIAGMCQQAVDVLKNHFTRSYDRWRSLSSGFQPTSAISVVNLARLTGEDSILPTALWMCCRLSATEIAKGYAYSDGEMETLSTEDLSLCYIARARLMQETICTMTATFSAVHTLVQADDPFSLHTESCRKLPQKILEGLNPCIRTFEHPNPLVQPSKHALLRPYVTSLCSACQYAVAKWETAARRKAWSRLPAAFGLEVAGWES